jgi:hypothetical protein
MKRLNWRTAKDTFLIVAALAITPLALWATRSRPLSVASLPELHEFIRNSRQDEILKPMTRRYEAVSLSFESANAASDPQIGWQEIQTRLQNYGVEGDEAREVIRIARSQLKEEWPCFVERGYLRNQPVWIVVGSLPSYTGFIAWVCPPSSQDIREEKIRKYCSDIQVIVISAEKPYAVLN